MINFIVSSAVTSFHVSLTLSYRSRLMFFCLFLIVHIKDQHQQLHKEHTAQILLCVSSSFCGLKATTETFHFGYIADKKTPDVPFKELRALWVHSIADVSNWYNLCVTFSWHVQRPCQWTRSLRLHNWGRLLNRFLSLSNNNRFISEIDDL